jgi:YjbR
MKLDTVRRFALSLEAVTEAPHHNYSSFRVRGKIFVTVPPSDELIHVFVGEADREPALAMYPQYIAKLLWSGKVVGLQVQLALADARVVRALVAKAYETRVLKDAGAKTERLR